MTTKFPVTTGEFSKIFLEESNNISPYAVDFTTHWNSVYPNFTITTKTLRLTFRPFHHLRPDYLREITVNRKGIWTNPKKLKSKKVLDRVRKIVSLHYSTDPDEIQITLVWRNHQCVPLCESQCFPDGRPSGRLTEVSP